jgi:hypothetical protein
LEQQNDDTGIILHDHESKVGLKNAFMHCAAIREGTYITEKFCQYPKHL